jgi:hypothetical protein
MMAVTKTSITGIPGISGPPMPARIMIAVIGLVLNVNVLLHVFDGDIAGAEWIKFVVVYVFSFAVPRTVAGLEPCALSAAALKDRPVFATLALQTASPSSSAKMRRHSWSERLRNSKLSVPHARRRGVE